MQTVLLIFATPHSILPGLAQFMKARWITKHQAAIIILPATTAVMALVISALVKTLSIRYFGILTASINTVVNLSAASPASLKYSAHLSYGVENILNIR